MNAIVIRPMRSLDEYHAVEALQRVVWGMQDDVEIVPAHLLLTMQMHGGLVLGALDGEALAGFAFGFLGRGADGALEFCSHMAGVAPGYQDRGIGHGLKLAQREHALAHGLGRVVWTFDPLQSRNAYFNLHKLGAVCRVYLRDLYGALHETLNAGLPTDRVRAEWHIAGARVSETLAGTRLSPALPALRAAGVPLFPGPSAAAPSFEAAAPGARALLEFPADIARLRGHDLPLARAWQQHVRAALETAFAAGYAARDVILDAGRCYYLLESPPLAV